MFHTRYHALLQVLADETDMPDYDDLMVSECLRLLEDSEVRVRLAVGQLLRSLAAKHGVAIIRECQGKILTSINDHFVSAWVSCDTVCGVSSRHQAHLCFTVSSSCVQLPRQALHLIAW